ncbi:hypothetical protein Acr_16g0001620 [Actinidia rufa]|uniref:Retrovirus-related Pol polyprotein from transposon TNT 1-94-like beta-barrel domain-containing protein n=1 Tax=Actinidia rufa TaxID=165716 RepID=A0A7J0G040_9ERIC|nr:hypothetical protein Acr_16g0001620 [Actinidia rufa]
MGSTDQSESQALVSEGSRERGRGQGRGLHRGIVQKYKAQDQSSDTAATAVMADDDEIDVLLAASDDGKSDWVLDSGSAYHLCRDREVFSTYAACEGRIWMANNTASRVVGRGTVRFRMTDGRSVTLTEVRHVPNLRKNLISIGMLDAKGCRFDASGGILRVSKGNKEMLWERRLEGYTDWRGVSRQGELLSDMGPVVLARRMDKGSNRCTEVRKASAGVPGGSGVDVHREAQRKETKSILRSCTAKGAAMPRRVSFALDLISGGVLSSCTSVWRCIHFGGKWSSLLMRLRYLSDAVLQSYEGAGSEVVRKDNLKTSDYPPVGWRGRLLSPAHLDESKPTWTSPSPVAKPKPDWSSCGVSM